MKTSLSAALLLLVVALSFRGADSHPAGHHRLVKRQQNDQDMPPMPFEFDWEVSDSESPQNGLFMRHEEKAEESNPGRTDGMYQVWFDDGRLMTVTYYVDGDSGFVPTVTWEDGHQPSF